MEAKVVFMLNSTNWSRKTNISLRKAISTKIIPTTKNQLRMILLSLQLKIAMITPQKEAKMVFGRRRNEALPVPDWERPYWSNISIKSLKP